MAIATTIFNTTACGNRRMVSGKSVLSGNVATGDVVTGLDYVDGFCVNVAGATQKGCSVNETFPLNSGDVTVVVETNDGTFYWTAFGY